MICESAQAKRDCTSHREHLIEIDDLRIILRPLFAVLSLNCIFVLDGMNDVMGVSDIQSDSFPLALRNR